MHRNIKEIKYFYNEFASEFDAKMNYYDLNKRIESVFAELDLSALKNASFLDAGCGTGWFSKKAVELGAIVTSMDIGDNLLKEVAKKCSSKIVHGSVTEMPFEDESFDYVVCSEVIEHLYEHEIALKEMYRVLKKGGILVLTTPNKKWFFLVWLASKLKLRPYQGIENWLTWEKCRKLLNQAGFKITKERGMHLFPFQLKIMHPVLDFFHRFNEPLAPVMINMLFKCKK